MPEFDERLRAAFTALVQACIDEADANNIMPPPWTTRIIIPIYRTPHGVEASCLRAAKITVENPEVTLSISYRKPAPEKK